MAVRHEVEEESRILEQFFHIGTVTSPHGVRGDVKVYPTTDEPDRFLDLKDVILRTNGREEIREISHVRFLKSLVVLHLNGIEDRTSAELYRNWELFVSRENAIPLEEGEYYVADLIGIKVYTEKEHLGILKDVLQTGANDVYVVESAQYGEVLIPAIKECILHVDPAGGRMEVHLLPGLV